MADMGLSTLGIKVYQASAEDGTKPTTGYTQLTRINAVGEVSLTPETIDASALEDLTSKFIKGRDTVTDTLDITINLTNETKAEWETILGKKVCIMIEIDGMSDAYFIIVTVPSKIPMPALDQNSLLTVIMGCTVNDFIGFDEKVVVA